MTRPTIEPVTDLTLPDFACFLHTNLQRDRTSEAWANGFKNKWVAERPNYGFVIRDAGQIVGGIGAYYSDRIVNGQPERFCNITSWCVLDAFRQQSMRLAMSVIDQRDYHFTDFSPTQVVGGTLKFFKFKELDERVAVILNLPRFSIARDVQVLDDSVDIQSELQGDALKIYNDHAIYPWLKHVLLGCPGHWCHIIYKQRSFKGLAAAAVLYLSDRDLFCRHFKVLSNYLLLHGFASTHVECRFLDKVPEPFMLRSGFNPKLYLSSTLVGSDIDYLYSETMALDL